MSLIDRARAAGAGHAVAGGDLGIGGLLEDAAQAAGGEQHGLARMCTGRLTARSQATAPAPRRPSFNRSVIAEKLWNSTLASEAALWYSVRAISRPVESPCACSTRLRLCAPSRANRSLAPSRSNSAPHSINSSMARRPFFDQRAHSLAVAQAVAGGERVLLRAVRTSSSSLSATAMPPCAYSEDDSPRLSLATTSTCPAADSSMAARSPATPAPTTRKSVSMCSACVSVRPSIPSWYNVEVPSYPVNTGHGCYRRGGRARRSCRACASPSPEARARFSSPPMKMSGNTTAACFPRRSRDVRTTCSSSRPARRPSASPVSKRWPKRWCGPGGDRVERRGRVRRRHRQRHGRLSGGHLHARHSRSSRSRPRCSRRWTRRSAARPA